MLTVDPRYFETIGLPLVRGRGLTDADGMTGQESAIINKRFAQMHFPNEDPIGRRIVVSIDPSVGRPGGSGYPAVADRNDRRRRAERAATRLRHGRTRSDCLSAVSDRPARVHDADGAQRRATRTLVTPVLREEVRAIDPDLPLFGIRTMDENLAQQRWPFRIFGTMFAIFAFIALMLSAVGLYAVTAYSVTQRTQEIGVRMALGAESSQVMWLFLRRSFVQLAIGLTLGIAGAFGVGKIFESSELLVQTTGRDPITIASIAALLAVVALAASVWPARAATQLDPLVALRREQ